MASAAAGETIIFIGSMVAAMVVATALGAVAFDYAGSLRERSHALAASYGEDIEVVNDPAHVPTSPLRIYVKNTGSASLPAASLTVLVDGTASLDVDVTVAGAPAADVAPGDLALLTINDIAPAAGDHHAVVLANAAQDTLDFAV